MINLFVLPLIGSFCLVPATCAQQTVWTFLDGSHTLNTGETATRPGSRAAASTWIDPTGNLWLFGGYGFKEDDNSSFLNDLWRYDLHENYWHHIKPVKPWPGGRSDASACGVPGLMFVIYGGSTVNNTAYNDTWMYDIVRNVWLPLLNETGPLNRGEAATWCTNTHMFVFSGINQATLLSDLWKFSLKDLKWSVLSTIKNDSSVSNPGFPLARKGAITWVTEETLYMFSGCAEKDNKKLYLSDFWSFNIVHNLWTLLSRGGNSSFPTARQGGLSWSHNGDLWLYGGDLQLPDKKHLIVLSRFGNDLWQYVIKTNRWNQNSGSLTSEEKSDIGHVGKAGVYLHPGARCSSSGWVYKNQFYLFGGKVHSQDQMKYTNDMWKWFLKNPPKQLSFSMWKIVLLIFVALCLLCILIVVGWFARSAMPPTTAYSLVSNSDSFDS